LSHNVNGNAGLMSCSNKQLTAIFIRRAKDFVRE
jgi:hypothetical protein